MIDIASSQWDDAGRDVVAEHGGKAVVVEVGMVLARAVRVGIEAKHDAPHANHNTTLTSAVFARSYSGSSVSENGRIFVWRLISRVRHASTLAAAAASVCPFYPK